MKVVVIGAQGALGTDCVKVFGDSAVPATRAEFDICDPKATRNFLEAHRPTHAINTAAFHQVPLCESEFERAMNVNALALKHLAEACNELQIHLCHISTDYVFDGLKKAPYVETDLPNPLSAYAISKVAGEHVVQAYAKNFSIIRSCGLYGEVPTRAKGGNFITTMARLGKERDRVTVVDDEWVTPTYTLDLACGIKTMLEKGGQGLMHITQSGSASWYQFAQIIFEVLKLPAQLAPISAATFQSTAKRPSYSILDNAKFKHLTGMELRPWDEALRDFLETNPIQM